MKTKILGGIFALAVMVATGYGVNRSMQKDTDLSEMAIKSPRFAGADRPDAGNVIAASRQILHQSFSHYRHSARPFLRHSHQRIFL